MERRRKIRAAEIFIRTYFVVCVCVCKWCVCVCVNWCVPLANNAKLALFIYANGCGQEATLAARNAGCSQCQHEEQLCCFPHCRPPCQQLVLTSHGIQGRLLHHHVLALYKDHRTEGEHHDGQNGAQQDDEPRLCQHIVHMILIDGIAGDREKGREREAKQN